MDKELRIKIVDECLEVYNEILPIERNGNIFNFQVYESSTNIDGKVLDEDNFAQVDETKVFIFVYDVNKRKTLEKVEECVK